MIRKTVAAVLCVSAWGCEPKTPVGPGVVTITETTTTTSSIPSSSSSTTTTTVSTVCGGTVASIVSLDKVAESVVIRLDAGPGDMTGWFVSSTRGDFRFTFSRGFVMGNQVEIRSGPNPCSNTSTVLCWTSASVWSDTAPETAQLFNCAGMMVSSLSR